MKSRAFSKNAKLILCFTTFLLALIFGLPGVAQAGKASSGELLWFPCDRCHPLGTKPIPGNFEGHRVTLDGHDQLGLGRAACVVCHDSGDHNPGLLRVEDGSLVAINGDVSRVCYRCHSEKYKQWKAGMHGKQPGCTTEGCHDPHTPNWIAISPLLPYLGTSLEVRVASERTPFKALPPPPDPPPTPFLPVVPIVASLGFLAVLALLIGPTLLSRFKR